MTVELNRLQMPNLTAQVETGLESRLVLRLFLSLILIAAMVFIPQARLVTILKESPSDRFAVYAVIRDSRATRLGITRVEPLCWIRRCFLKPAKSRLTVSREVPIICPISS